LRSKIFGPLSFPDNGCLEIFELVVGRVEGNDRLFGGGYGVLTRLEKNWFVLFCEGGKHALVLDKLGCEESPLGFDAEIVCFSIWRLGLRGQRREPGVLGPAGEM